MAGAADVLVSGTRAYVADYFDGALRVIDIGDPTNPDRGSVNTPDLAVAVAISVLTHIADYYAGLQVISIGNPPILSL